MAVPYLQYWWAAMADEVLTGLDFWSSNLLGKRTRLDQESDDSSNASDAAQIQRQFFLSIFAAEVQQAGY
jgi:hypothetical protein